MNGDAPIYHLPAVRDLLLAAYADAQALCRFLLYSEHLELRLARNEFGSNDGLAMMVDKLVEYCVARDLFSHLLAAIEQDNRAQYEHFAPRLRVTPPRSRIHKINFCVKVSDVLDFPADVLALKFADALYGADQAVAYALQIGAKELEAAMPSLAKSTIIASHGRVAAAHVLFVRVGDLFQFDYDAIRQFSHQVLNTLAGSNLPIRHLAMTIHGAGYGLDVTEALRSQLAGYLDAFEVGDYPPDLEEISLVERNPARATRLQTVLNAAIPVGSVELLAGPPGTNRVGMAEPAPFMANVGRASAQKPYVYVAKSQTDEMDDIYYYGIHKPVHAAGYLCETAAITSFSGDCERVLSKIKAASLVVAELSDADPSVMLQVGYAWGNGRPTLLLVRDPDRLPPLVRSHRWVMYKRIRELEAVLGEALRELA